MYKVISHRSIGTECKRREDFCNDAEIQCPDGSFLFMPCDIRDADSYSYSKAKYDLRMYGTLINGAKACVNIIDVRPYFEFDISALNVGEWRLGSRDADIRRPAERAGEARMREILNEIGIPVDTIIFHPVWLYPLGGFTLLQHLYFRLSFESLRDRSSALGALHTYVSHTLQSGVTLESLYPNIIAHDDDGYTRSYFNAMARDSGINTAGWNVIRPTARSVAGRVTTMHVFDVPIGGIRPISDNDRKSGELSLMQDRILIESWDIEVESNKPNGDIPMPGDDYTITTISLVYSYHWCKHPLECYVLSIYPSDNPAERAIVESLGADNGMRVIFIECGTERDMLIARARIAERMMPDICVAFNGSCFDWPLFNDKVQRYGIQSEIITRMDLAHKARIVRGQDATDYEREYTRLFNREPVKIKVAAGNDHVCKCIARFAGMLDIDLMPAMRQLYKNEEVRFAQSLNTYLARCQLPPKIDIHFRNMMCMLRRARDLEAPGVIRECHCNRRSECAFCARADTFTREIDLAPVDGEKPMREWTYCDGRVAPRRLRDPRLELCCACGARPISRADIASINTYCAIDSVRPLQLIAKRSIIIDHREIACATYTSLSDTFIRAGGSRVINFTAAFASKFEIAVSIKVPKRNRVHYQGAYVFPPHLGYCQRGGRMRPVVALDFSSLYPSIMLTYNISPERIVYSEDAARELESMGYHLQKIEQFNYDILSENGRNIIGADTAGGWIVRHSGIMNPHRISGDTPNDERPVTKFTNAAGDDISDRPALPREHMGMFGTALRTLLDSRRDVRRQMAKYAESIEGIYKRVSGGDVKFEEKGPSDQLDHISSHFPMSRDDINSVSHMILARSSLDSKQLALKVLANTFYGQMGSNTSPLFSLVGAAGVTELGRYNIKRVAAFLRERGYTIVYGDTDSVYTISPEYIFEQIESREWSSTRDRWSAMVVAAREDISRASADVAAFLRADNGTRFLTMAYEEVGMPGIFLGKKKYALRPHVTGVTFDAKPMVRGLEFIKGGNAAILRTIGNIIMEELLEVNDNLNPTDIIVRHITKLCTSIGSYDISQFIQYGTYKPAKDNAKIKRFVARMNARIAEMTKAGADAAAIARYEPPEPGDKFQYVIVRHADEISASGHMIKARIGDKMEYPHTIESGECVIDHEYYINGAVLSVMARFIISDPQFDPRNDPSPSVREYWRRMFVGDELSETVKYDEYDDYRRSRAEAYLQSVCAQYDARDHSASRVLAARCRSTIGALRDIVKSSAIDRGIVIDARIIRVLIHDDMPATCGNKGDVIADESVSRVADIILEIAGDMTKSEKIAETEANANHARCLMSSNMPEALAARYARANFEKNIIGPIDTNASAIESRIRGQFAADIIRLYRAKDIATAISQIARDAVRDGEKNRAALRARINECMSFTENNLTVFGGLLKCMTDYAATRRAMRREMAMRLRFAADC